MAAMLCGLCIAAIAARAAIAHASGLWADEGFFIAIVHLPTTSDMLQFLRHHESHPPLFYLLMRGWWVLAGRSDAALLWLAIMIGVAIVPTTYAAASAVFSRQVGIIAACLVTVSATLAEHSSQLRPYGLLPVLTILSTCVMILALQRNRRVLWVAYVATCLALLYTHHWGWLIAFSQQVAAWLMIIRDRPQKRAISSLLGADIAILIGYLPWLAAFLFQIRHTGHGSLTDGMFGQLLEVAGFAVFTAIQTFLPSRYPHVLIETLTMGVAAIAWVFVDMRIRRRDVPLAGETPRLADDTSASRFLVTVIIVTLAITILAAPWTSLIYQRCLATLLPLVLVLLTRSFTSSGRFAPVSSAILAVFVINSVFELIALSSRPRSNARELAASIKAQARPDDLLLVAPEWYAPSFNYYFDAPIEQIDFPSETRVDLVDFANVWARTSDPDALKRTLARIRDAAAGGRRVWAVFGPQFDREVSAEDLAKAYRNRTPGPVSVQRVRQIRAYIESLYGPGARLSADSGQPPIYDDLHGLLYTAIPRGSMR